MPVRSFHSLLLSALGVVCFTTPASAQIAVSTFDTSNEDWHVIDRNDQTFVFREDRGPAGYSSTGGNPGGYIVNQDDDYEWYWRAPAKFLGNVSSAYNGSLSFDVISDLFRDPISSEFDLFLSNGTTTLYANYTMFPERNTWSSYSVSLNEGAWLDFDTRQRATAEQMNTVLSSLTILDIRGEFGNNADIGGLDNVRLMAAPAPGALVTAFFGAVPGAALLLRRRKR